MKDIINDYIFKPIWFHIVSFFFFFFQITGYIMAKNGTIVWNAGNSLGILLSSAFLGIITGTVVNFLRCCSYTELLGRTDYGAGSVTIQTGGRWRSENCVFECLLASVGP